MHTLQRLDRRLGPPVARVLAALPRRRGTERVERALFVKFWGIGSLQLLTPAVRSWRKRHPRARLELLTLAQNRPFAEGLHAFDGVRTLDVARSWGGIARALLGTVRELRRARFDAVFDLEFFTHASAVLSRASGAPYTVGFGGPRRLRAGLHTQTVPFRREWHVARNFRALVGGETGRPVGWRDLLPFHVTDGHRAELAAALFATPPRRGPRVVLNPNAGRLSLERRWPLERFALLARRLVHELGAAVVIAGAPDEAPRGRRLLERAGPLPPGALVDSSGRLGIGALCALLESADLVVTNDSGPMHVAAALGAPTLGLFGPETPRMYAPLGPRAHFLWSPPPCGPCLNVHDNKLGSCLSGDPECMRRIPVEAVLAVARAELGGRGEVRGGRAPRAEAATGGGR